MSAPVANPVDLSPATPCADLVTDLRARRAIARMVGEGALPANPTLADLAKLPARRLWKTHATGVGTTNALGVLLGRAGLRFAEGGATAVAPQRPTAAAPVAPQPAAPRAVMLAPNGRPVRPLSDASKADALGMAAVLVNSYMRDHERHSPVWTALKEVRDRLCEEGTESWCRAILSIDADAEAALRRAGRQP